MNLKKLVDNLTKKGTKNTMFNILVLFLIGIFIVIVTSFFGNKPNLKTNAKATAINEEEAQKESFASYEQKQKEQLKYILNKIDGVGNVEAIINFEGSEEQVPAVDVNRSVSTTQEKDTSGGSRQITQNNDGSKIVMSNKGNGSEPLILKTYKPKVVGVIIVAEGAEDKKIQYSIVKAISNFYGIPENKVNVYSMKK